MAASACNRGHLVDNASFPASWVEAPFLAAGTGVRSGGKRPFNDTRRFEYILTADPFFALRLLVLPFPPAWGENFTIASRRRSDEA